MFSITHRLDQASRGYPVTLMMLELQRLAKQNQNADVTHDIIPEVSRSRSTHLRVHRRSLSEGSAPSLTSSSPKKMVSLGIL